MAYCNKCKIEVDSFVKKCPLCNSEIQKGENIEQILDGKPYPDEIVEEFEEEAPIITGKRKKFVVWEAVSVSAVVPILIILAINMIVENRFIISWSRYPVTAIILVWILITVPLFLFKHPIAIITGETLSIIAFLVLIDVYDNSTVDWYYQIALPIIGVILVVTTAVVILSVKVKNKGANIGAFVLFGISMICLGLDFVINITIFSKLSIGWSLYVIIPLIIVGGFILYLHYRLTKIIDMKRVLELRKKLQT